MTIQAALSAVAACGLVALLMSPAWANDSETNSESARTQQLQDLKDALADTAKRKAKIAGELKQLKAETEALSQKLVAMAGQVRAFEARLTRGEDTLQELDKRETKLLVKLTNRREAMAELLAGLQRLERNPPPPLAAHPGDAVAAIRGATLFAAIVPELEKQSTALAQALNRLKAVRAAQNAQRHEIDDNLERLQLAHKELAALVSHKQILVTQTQGDYHAQEQKAAKLAAKASSLQDLTNELVKDRQQKTAEMHEEERWRLEIMQRPKVAFTKAKGRLEYPVQGRAIRRFGDKNGFGGHTKGDFLVTRRAAQVITPTDALVEYAGDFRTYGKLLILDVGEGYHVLLAGLEHITAKTGQQLRAGEPVGKMGVEPARGTLIGDNLEETRPILYIEFRRNGNAIDPDPWWVGSRTAARS